MKVFGRLDFPGLKAALALLIIGTSPLSATATDLPLFGPERFDRLKGAPTVYTGTFARCEPSSQAVLRIWNGDSDRTRITAAEIFVNGIEAASEELFKKKTEYFEIPLAIGVHNEFRIVLKSGDFKEPSFLRIEFQGQGCDVSPPTIHGERPLDGSLLNTARPTIGAEYSDAEPGAAGIDLESVALFLDGEDVTAAAAVSSSGISYIPSHNLPEGEHRVELIVIDRAGNRVEEIWTFTTDTIPPAPVITSQSAGQYLNTPVVTVAGSLDDPTAAVTVNGVAAVVVGSGFSLSGVTLSEGANTLTVVAIDPAGNAGSHEIVLHLDTVPPQIAVATPEPDSFVNTPAIVVAGSVNEPVLQVVVNALPAVVSGQQFRVDALALVEGANMVAVTATDYAGNHSTVSIPLTLDTIPPAITIAAPAAGFLTNLPAIDLVGNVNEPVFSVSVNGLPATLADQQFSRAAVPLTEEGNFLEVIAIDRAGNIGTATVQGTLDTVAPPPPALVQPASPTNIAATGLIGSAEAHSTVRLFARGPQDASSVLLATVTADAGGLFQAEISLAEGESVFTATAVDAAGNESPPSAPVAVLLDTVVPAITVTFPVDQSLTEELAIRVIGTLSEAADLTLDGVAVALDGTAFDHPVTLVPGSNTLILLATDAAGNTGTAAVTVHADNTPPTVILSSPADGTLTRFAQVTVAGSISEEASLTLNGQPLAATERSFSAPYTLQEGENILTVAAVDRAGNSGSAEVRVVLDSLPPLVTLSAPAEGTAGRNLELTLAGSDAGGLELLELRAGGLLVWSESYGGAASAGDSIAYSLSPTLSQGATIELQARAVDRAGNEGSAAAQVLVTQAAAGPGTLQGEVYDDRRGLRLAAADFSVMAAAEAAAGQATAEGDYFTELAAGEYLVRLSKPGYTAVERIVSVRSEQNAAPLDARLTPDAAATRIPVPMTEAMTLVVPLPDGPGIELTLPAGALEEEIALRLTPVSNQGLAGLLPPGWSPLAVVDIRALHALTGELLASPPILVEPARLSVPLPAGVEGVTAAELALARYDEARHQWVAVSTVLIDADRLRTESALVETGQYALVAADPDPLAPPGAENGQPLAPVADAAELDFDYLAAVGRVVPPASPPLQGLIAIGEVVLAPGPGAAALSSGAVVNARITERFELAGGETLQPADYVQDLLLYRYPCVTNPRRGTAGEAAGEGSLRSTFPVSPSRDFGFVDLLLGKVGVEIWPAEQKIAEGMMIGPDGARLLTEAGDALEIPAGALSRTTPVALRPVGAGAAGVIGGDFELLRALAVDLTGQTLQSSATLSIPVPAGFDPARPVVLARVVEVGGVQRLKLVGFGRLSGSMIVSTVSRSLADGSTVAGAGITVSGTYVFLQGKAAIGLVVGRVDGIGGLPFAGARVSAAGATLVDLTGSDGRYLLALPLASASITALDPLKWDKGEGSVHPQTPWQRIILDLAIAAAPPRLLGIVPADGAVGVEPNAVVRLTFSEPVERASINEQTVALKDADGTAVPGVFSFTPDGAVVSFYPGAALRSETRHTLTVGTGVRDLQGYPLAQGASSAFTTRDTTPPPPPPAGSITATFPDEQGMITVTATQGSAEADCTVLVINDTTGEIVAVTPQSNGSFTARIAAQLGDQIQIVLMDAAGNQTLVSWLTFKAPDGRYLVTAKGGKVEGEGGLRLDIPEGALVGPAVVKITPVLEAALPHPVPAEGRFLAAVQIDTGGVPFQKEVKLSLPVPAGMPADAVPFLAQPKVHVNADGSEEEVYVIHDSAKVVDGRLTTASPPFAGVSGFGIFSFLYTPAPLLGPVIVSGTTYRDMDGLGGYMPGVDQPIRGAVIRCPGAENFLSYSDSNGHYATYGFTARDVCRNFALTAIHPQTMFRHTANITTCDAPYIVNNFNFKLADKGTQIPDKTPPVIELDVRAEPGQGVRMASGTVPVGTRLQVGLSVIDQAGKTVLLTASHRDELIGEQSYSVPLGSGSSTLYRPKDGEIPALFRVSYQPQFSSPLGSGALFQPNAPGFYTLTVEATDEAGNTSTRSRQIRAVLPGAIPAGIEGPPFVISTVPGGNAADIRIDTSVRAVFSEMVENVTESTFQLIDTTTGQPVPAMVTLNVEEGTVQAVLLPTGNLHFGRRYEILLTREITDTGGNQSADGEALPLASDVRTAFTTQSPRAYDLVEGAFGGGRDIDLYFDARTGKTYSYVTAGAGGWRIIDVTEADQPRTVYPGADYKFPAGFDYRGVAVDQESGRLAITENIVYASGGQYGYVRFYDLTGDPASPVHVGQERVAEAYSGIPGRLALNGRYAYIATVNAGLQVVDIEAAIEFRKTGKVSDGSSIVGVFDSVIQGFGHPHDIRVYKGNRAILASNGGYLLALDLTMPQIPMLVSAFKPAGILWQGRFSVVPDYVYEEADGSIRSIDLVIGGTRDGRLRTADFSDPANPRLLGIAMDGAGNEVSTLPTGIAVNKMSGLAFVTTFNSVQVFDLRDPTQPRLLSTIIEIPDQNGNLVPIGSLPDLVERNGWVYLASEAKGMRTLNLAGEEGITYYCDDCYPVRAGR